MSRPRRRARWLLAVAAWGLVIWAAILLVPRVVTFTCSGVGDVDPGLACEDWPPPIAALLILGALLLAINLLVVAYSRLRGGTPGPWQALLGGIVLIAGGLIAGVAWLRWIFP